MAKIEIFPLCIGYSCTTLWVKNSLEITLSLTVFEIFTLFHFPLKSKMAAKSGENWNFYPRHRTLLYYPVGQKFARNCSISYHFEDIFNVYFPLKSKMAAKSGENWNVFPLAYDTVVLPCGSKNSCKIAPSLYGFRDIHTFPFSTKIQDGRQKWRKLKFFPFP